MSVFSKLKDLFSSSDKPGQSRLNVKQRFEILGRTGQGSMSKVFRARDKQIGRIVCLKLLDKEKTSRFEARFPGLNRPPEGAICMSLRHPNIVTTHEFGTTTDGEQYLVMEWIDGMGLNFIIETRHSSLASHRHDFVIQLASGLEAIHQQGYLHRDICPRNAMVTKENVVKYIDFGLAVPNRPEFGKPGNRTGTADYLAPELIKRVTTDHRVDLFALGVTAYEVFTDGQMPWERGQSMQTIMSHLNKPGRNPRDHNPKIDDQTAKVLLKAIERDPKARFQTAGEFRQAFERLQRKG